VDAGGTEVRLLTVSVTPEEQGSPIGFVQGGLVLVLHDQQSQGIVVAIVLVAAVGLIGAAFVTLIVTGGAFAPIRRSFEAQRRFVADASHELRTPAALIRANAEVMEREGLMADEGKPLVADIITEADRLSRLVGELLQLAASETSASAVELRPVDLGVIAADTVRQATALATSRQADLVMGTPAPTPAIVNGDRDRLVQLLLILLDNALDHSPSGGTVTVEVQWNGRNVELIVADQGPGIAESERERVFEPFTRLPGVRRDRSGGTGLGLAIARRIATAHRGTIRITDAPGGGAAVVVTIPAAGDLTAS
jgi:signal transduction histidine kinase